MTCIIIDNEPFTHEALKLLIHNIERLELVHILNDAESGKEFIRAHPVDLIFLNIRIPNVTGIEFAHVIHRCTLVIFLTTSPEYLFDEYEVEAIDYLVKPINPEKFKKAVDKAISYHTLLLKEEETVLHTSTSKKKISLD